mmetsp:Transcript_46661/g.134378  ORF Transcript_46661/g.134378 Transcript_46661/m.134378 type:complete len:214 (+) Transcript_46661:307-948(+)
MTHSGTSRRSVARPLSERSGTRLTTKRRSFGEAGMTSRRFASVRLWQPVRSSDSSRWQPARRALNSSSHMSVQEARLSSSTHSQFLANDRGIFVWRWVQPVASKDRNLRSTRTAFATPSSVKDICRFSAKFRCLIPGFDPAKAMRPASESCLQPARLTQVKARQPAESSCKAWSVTAVQNERSNTSNFLQPRRDATSSAVTALSHLGSRNSRM